MVYFSPSILAADFSSLREEIKKVEKADYLHLDVMDGLFVPNISFGKDLIEAIRPYSSLKFDTHLMIDKPGRYIEQFAQAGSDLITFHAEATNHIERVVQQIKNCDCQVGIALNPATPLSLLDYVLEEIDLVLIMSVNPGFGGQKFITPILNKISELHQIIDKKELNVKIEVDGGINKKNIKEVVGAGTDIIVAGSAIFKEPNPAQTLLEMKKLF